VILWAVSPKLIRCLLLNRLMKHFLPLICLLIVQSGVGQMQTCPLNNNFSLGNLTHWQAYTGNNSGGNGPQSIKLWYDSSAAAPSGTLGNSLIYEYNLPSTPGIQIISTSTTDPYGKFPTIPTINGYQYANSILLGSTAITRSNGGGTGGGYVRGVSYRINVPAGPADVPYTMTYAYAMILENGTHNSAQQPLFSATLKVGDSVITCASPQYFLPTHNNADSRGSGAVLDTALAKSEGIYLSDLTSPNSNPNSQSPNAEHLRDVWAKGWTEVTFDLSPWRGQAVVLTFETDNCVPGGHFAYSYVALRNTCGGLEISGPQVACIGSTLTYSVPALAGAAYQWSVPGDWSIVSGTDTSVLQVKIGNDVGTVTAHEQNSCANLQAILNVTTSPPTVAGAVKGGPEVCTGTNSSLLTLTGSRGSILNWLSSTDGVTYSVVSNQSLQYTAQNLTATTSYRALVQNGGSCSIDTSAASTVLVDPMTVGGKLTPPAMQFCLGQNKDALLVLENAVGEPVNWQSSTDGITWTDFSPAYTDSEYSIIGMTQSTSYRVKVQSGVCPAELSEVAAIGFVNVPFPQATAFPADTLICYNTSATLNTTISIGTEYAWTNTSTLTNAGTGVSSPLPYVIQATASPAATTLYVLSIENSGCPNLLKDSFLVRVLPPVLVNAGNDTVVVINQPLQLHATSNDTTTPGGPAFAWTPIIGLNDPNIADPIGMYTAETDSVRYLVTATTGYGCKGYAQVLVKIFKTDPDIFVPNAFTPGGPANTVFRPIAPGIASLQYFMVYNRWGQLVFQTSRLGQGWDGMFNGRQAELGGYVWMVQGMTYTGKIINHRGTMVLVR